MKLIEEIKDNSISVSEMKDGQIGVVTQWSRVGYVGMIVQRHGESLILLGGKEVDAWSNYKCGFDCRVRILTGKVTFEI